ncbi:hypothetical protein [Planctomicrobium sp. SH664]|uniref:hypothetical protein n=1 Tax=Planctomicrobium sp. SH664 TaxID=3448125 RepID=UPI003F5AF77F
MSATTEFTTASDAHELSPYPVRKWSLEEYHSLINQGMFDEERGELLEGWVVPKMTRTFHTKR